MRTFLTLLMIFILFFPPLSCEKSEEATYPEKMEVEQDQAVITFIEGDVYTSRSAGEWEEAEVNDILEKGDVLKTGERSFCELQCINTSFIRIQEHTILELEHLLLRENSYSIDMGLSLGTILCKIDHLTMKDEFTVSTEAAVCSVRGTVFGIEVKPDKKTSIFVKKGKVSVVPGAINGRKIKEKLKHTPQLLTEVISEIEKQAVLVEESQEVVISRETMLKTNAVLFEVNTMVDEMSKKEMVKEEERQKLVELVKKKTLDTHSHMTPPVRLSEEHKTLLEEAEQQKKKKLIIIKDKREERINTIEEKDDEDTLTSKEATDTPEEKKKEHFEQTITIVTVPEKAKVIVDDTFHGFSPFVLRDVPPGEHILRFEKEGYRIHEKVVFIEESSDLSLKVILKEVIPDMTDLVIESDPPGAAIHLDGEYRGRSPRKIPDVEFGDHTIVIEMQEFVTTSDVISVNDTDNKYLYPLIPVKIEE
jgi:hypothetical protein